LRPPLKASALSLAMARAFAFLPVLLVGVNALQAELTDKDFKSKSEGKNALYFFQAPW